MHLSQVAKTSKCRSCKQKKWALGPVFKLDWELTSRASPVAQMAKSQPAAQETWVNPWAKRIPWRRDWLLTLVCLLAEFHGQRNLAGYLPWDHKELDMNERLAFSLFFQSTTHKWSLNDIISPPHSSFVGRRRGGFTKKGRRSGSFLIQGERHRYSYPYLLVLFSFDLLGF